jgi:hypothetical protein
MNNKTFWSCTNATARYDNSTPAGLIQNVTGSLNSSHGTSSEVQQLLQSAWLVAPVCRDSPGFNNSVSDTLGRYESKHITGHQVLTRVGVGICL